jgi:hypothetical protein
MVKNGIYSFFRGLSMGKTLLPAGSAGASMIYHPSKCHDMPVKQAQIEPKKAKEELRPI